MKSKNAKIFSVAIIIVSLLIGIIYIFMKSNNSEKLPENTKSVANIENIHTTPNGQKYAIVSYENTYFFKKINQDETLNIGEKIEFSTEKFSKNFANESELTAYIDENNPRITEEWTNLVGKKFVIDNFENWHIKNENGEKIAENLENREKAMNFVQVYDHGYCQKLFKSYISRSNGDVNIASELSRIEQEMKEIGSSFTNNFGVIRKYLGKIRVIEIIEPVSCPGNKEIIAYKDEGNYTITGENEQTFQLSDGFNMGINIALGGAIGWISETYSSEKVANNHKIPLIIETTGHPDEGRANFMSLYVENQYIWNLSLGTKNLSTQSKNALKSLAKNINAYPQEWTEADIKKEIEEWKNFVENAKKIEKNETLNQSGKYQNLSSRNVHFVGQCTSDTCFEKYNVDYDTYEWWLKGHIAIEKNGGFENIFVDEKSCWSLSECHANVKCEFMSFDNNSQIMKIKTERWLPEAQKHESPTFFSLNMNTLACENSKN